MESLLIGMLMELKERGQKCAQYWPSDRLLSFEDITVELKKKEDCESASVKRHPCHQHQEE